MAPLRPIAFYLPQFHPIPENDDFWGPGFTEWHNVARSRPRYRGHYQPHLPSTLGFYDLRLADARAAQAELARKAGLYGFCYYHYWFSGRRVLEKPLEGVLQSGEPDFPFMLCWANENWTRAWDGGDKEILLKQEYSDLDARRHIRHLLPIFSDHRYIRIDGKPVFAIYNTDDIPDPLKFTDRFRQEAARHGISLYLIRVERYLDQDLRPPAELGFDAALDFQPFSRSFRRFQDTRPDLKSSLSRRIANRLKNEIHARPFLREVMEPLIPMDRFHDLRAFVDFDVKQPAPNYTLFPGACPSWDNSPRRPEGEAIIFKNSSPQLFENWLAKKSERFSPPSEQENLLFINAWNEWGEGCHLEPCQRLGHAYLDAIRGGIDDIEEPPRAVRPVRVSGSRRRKEAEILPI